MNKEQIIGGKGFLYRIKATGNNGFIYLLEQKTYKNLKPKKIQCLKRLLKKSNAYYKKDKIKDKLDDWELAEYLGGYTIFLVRKGSLIKVEPWYEIE